MRIVALIALMYGGFMGLLSKAPAARGVKSVFWDAELPKLNLGKFSILVYHIFLYNLKGVALVWQQFISYIKKENITRK